MSEQKSEGQRKQRRQAGLLQRKGADVTSLRGCFSGLVSGLLLPKSPLLYCSLTPCFNVDGIFVYKKGSEATKTLMVRAWVLSSTRKALGPLSAQKGSAGAPGVNMGLTPRSQHSMNKRQGKIVFILNPQWKGCVIYLWQWEQ